jgi:hypothetical protein
MSTEMKFDTWALVELFGHQRIVGKCTEAVVAGGAFLRVDVPADRDKPAFTRLYGAAAIYSINPISEEIARALLQHQRAEPVQRYELPALAEKVREEMCPDCGELESECTCPTELTDVEYCPDCRNLVNNCACD